MYSQNNSCPKCNTENTPNARFCCNCGAPLEGAEKRVCTSCGTELRPIANFCDQCGARYGSENFAYTPRVKKASSLPFVRRIITSSLMLLIAICLCVCAFLPTTVYRFDEIDDLNIDEPFSLRMSAIDHLTFLFDSFKNSTEKELEKSNLYDKWLESYQDIQSISTNDSLSRSEMRDIERFIKLTARLGLASEATSPSARYIMPALSSVLYIAFAFTFLGISIYDFVRTFTKKEKRKSRCISLLCLAPFATLFNFFACQNSLFDFSDGLQIKMGMGLLALLISVVGVVWIVLDRIIFEKKRVAIKQTIISSVSIALAMVCMFLALGNAFSISITGKFSGKTAESTETAKIESEFYKEFELNKAALESFDGTTKEDFNNYVKSILRGTAKSFRNGEALLSVTMSIALTMFWWSGSAMPIYSVIYYVALIAVLLLALLAWRATVALYNQEPRRRRSAISFAAFALIASVIYLAGNIVFTLLVNMALEKYKLDSIMSAGMVAAPIILVVLAIGALVCTVLLPKPTKKAVSFEMPKIDETAPIAE